MTFANWLVMDEVLLFQVSKLFRDASVHMTEGSTHLALNHLHDAITNAGVSVH